MKINSKAPLFKLNSTDNEIYSLKDSLGKYVVLYFYPKDDTPGCTIETNDFNKLLPKLKKLNCDVFGISKDDLKSHYKFKEKYKIKFDLLSDVNRTVSTAYDVLFEGLGGIEGYTCSNRAVFILKGGVVKYQWIAPNPGVEPDYNEIKNNLN